MTAMGLDFSHGDAHFSYSGFNHFREALADYAGAFWNPSGEMLGSLLNHSDCDGLLTPAECRQVEPHLRHAVQQTWPQDDYYHHHGIMLADGMRAAADADEPLRFM